jgi:hypothetical protein
MDELTMLRDLGSDTPGPTAAETVAARARLQAAIDGAQSSPEVCSGRRRAGLARLARPRVWAPVGAAAAVTAVAVAAAVLAAPGLRGGPTASLSQTLPGVRILDEAATAAAHQQPGQGRYFFTEREYVGPTGPSALQMTWIGDGVFGRTVPGGPGTKDPGKRLPVATITFGNATISWALLRDLPTAPRRLLADVIRVSGYPGRPASDGTEFDTIATLLAQAPLTPALRSALYRVMATLPGLRVVPRSHDPVGRPAAVVRPPGGAGRESSALFFDPATGNALGLARYLAADGRQCASEEFAVLFASYVSSGKVIPAGTPGEVFIPASSALPGIVGNCPDTPGGKQSPTAGGKPSPTPGGKASPTPGGEPSPIPVGKPSPTPGGKPSPTPGGSPSPNPTAGNPSPTPTRHDPPARTILSAYH